MRPKIVAANWKMNGDKSSVGKLLKELKELLPENMQSKSIIFPPAIFLDAVQNSLQAGLIRWGAQNIYPAVAGAYTGETSSTMLRDYGCEYVLIGHSERRYLLNETEKFIADKFHHVKEHGMIPVLCIGETLEEYENGHTEAKLAQQLRSIVRNEEDFKNAIIAYEPVWAIGTGKTAMPEQIQAVHMSIRTLLNQLGQTNSDSIPLLYGGSVNETNAKAIFSMPDVDGGLIGGASLNARQFVEIVKCIN